MSDPATSSFTDLLVNQPVLVWSLAGGISILVIAGFLSLFLSVRKRAQQNKAEQEALRAKNQSNGDKIDTAVAELKTFANEAGSAGPKENRKADKKGAPSAETVTIPDEAASEDGAATAQVHETAEFSGGSLFTAEQIAQSGGELVDDDEELDAIDDQESEETEHTEEEQNELAALFQDDIIIDPYVQALRDNLPAITIDQLLTNIRSVSSELREKINAEHVAQG